MAAASIESYRQPASVDIETVRALRRAVKDCSDRGLSVASKWASELLNSISPRTRREATFGTHSWTPNADPPGNAMPTDAKSITSPSSTSLVTTTSTSTYASKSPRASTLVNTAAGVAGRGAGYGGKASQHGHGHASPEEQYYYANAAAYFAAYDPHPSFGPHDPPQYGNGNGDGTANAHAGVDIQARRQAAEEALLELDDEDALACARAYVGGKEFERAAYTLRGRRSAKARFLRMYAQFLASEKTALRDWHKLDHTRGQPPTPANNTVLEMLNALDNETDPWLLFLRGLFLSRASRRSEALESVLLSLSKYPWNWAAWTLLCSMLADLNELSALTPLLPLPPSHPLVQLFTIKAAVDMQGGTRAEVTLCDRLLGAAWFPESVWIMSLRALILYYDHEFAQAEAQFNKILALDPHRIDDIDVFSNILYVSQNRTRLSKLAHDMLALDKDRPEVCCLVGNHYSLRADHEKAVRYFRRATQLDPTFLAAWTLMGHEYVEMKNPHAAIEAYRRAVDVNRKDYRAWYGLGQAYELLSMHQYALHYFHRATALRPYDVRLWQAQGACYEELSRPREAIECFKRALLGADPHETTINLKLAKLYIDIEEYAEAAAYHRRVVEVCRASARSVPDYAKSAMWVARYHMHLGGGDLGLAREYIDLVAASNAEEVGQAVELQRKLRGMIAPTPIPIGGLGPSGATTEKGGAGAGTGTGTGADGSVVAGSVASGSGAGAGAGGSGSGTAKKRDTAASAMSDMPSWVTSNKPLASTPTASGTSTPVRMMMRESGGTFGAGGLGSGGGRGDGYGTDGSLASRSAAGSIWSGMQDAAMDEGDQ